MRRALVQRIDRAKAFAYFDRTEGWTRDEVEDQVLTPLDDASVMGTTESDPLSIMCYQLPGSIMKDRKPIRGGVDINPKDHAFASGLYPKPPADSARRFDETAGAQLRRAPAPQPGQASSAPLHLLFFLMFPAIWRNLPAVNRLVAVDSQPKNTLIQSMPHRSEVIYREI